MKTGIIGARGVGKSTVFHALTGLAPLPGQAEGRNRARPGQIKVADERLDFLERTYGSKKRVEVEVNDLAHIVAHEAARSNMECHAERSEAHLHRTHTCPGGRCQGVQVSCCLA